MKRMVDGQWVEEGQGRGGRSGGDFNSQSVDLRQIAEALHKKREAEKKRRQRRRQKDGNMGIPW